MAYQDGDIKTFNPQKEISKEITLEILIRHRDALKQARTGEMVGMPVERLSDNDRKMNQAKALNLIIAAQREMVTISRPIMSYSSLHRWKKKYKDEKEQKENPFEDEDNDYNQLMYWLSFLRYCEREIITAERTQTPDDDFLKIKQDQVTGGEIYELADNFFDMLEDLEGSYEKIYLLMLTNKIVSAGIEEDEEMTYKEQENEAIRRIVEA